MDLTLGLSYSISLAGNAELLEPESFASLSNVHTLRAKSDGD